MVYGAPYGARMCALRRAGLCSGGRLPAAGDMRAERAEMGYTGAEIRRRYAEGYGRYGHKKNTLPRDIGILLFFNLIWLT